MGVFSFLVPAQNNGEYTLYFFTSRIYT